MLENFINKEFTYAIVGASNNPEKYGNKIFRDLKNAGYTVIPVNLKETNVEGVKAYSNLTQLLNSISIDLTNFIVDFVIPPHVVIEVLNEVKELGIKKVWMQPGSESEEAIRFCRENGIECVYDRCIMIERRKNMQE